MLKVGLIGVGGISGAHIPAWDAMEDVELCALCDVRPERMEEYKDSKRCYTDLDTMLENEQLDILDICLPTYLHADTAIRVMDRGIHVLCEKPISLKLEDVKRVYDAAKRNRVCFMVAHVLRFWAEFELVKAIYEDGRYGKLLSGTMCRLNAWPLWSWDGWMSDEKRSGLVLYDLHVHDLDFLVYMLGKPNAITANRSLRADQDYMMATYTYGDFFITCEASWYAGRYPFSSSFRFQFEDAVVSFNQGVLVAYLRDGRVIKLMEQEGNSPDVLGLPDLGPYANEIRYFTDCVLAGKPADKIKPSELEEVIRLLDSFKK